MLELPPLSLYIHIPWCVRKCPYCDFNSHALNANKLPEVDYIRQLLNDFTHEKQNISGRSLQSIFIGGGTPSLFSPQSIGILLSALSREVKFSPSIEITMEANPGTFEQKKFNGFKSAGINRLSIGIQSFNNHQLKQLGRIHDRNEALHAVTVARKAGFDNINLDLMHGLPNQTVEQALDDISQAVSFNPEHISWYQLTIEPNTVFYSKPPTLPIDDILWDMQEAGFSMLKEAGFHQYEISAWSQPKQASLHNTNYWQFGDYIGIGAGAHGKITSVLDQMVIRRWKKRMPSAYLEQKNTMIAGEKIINPKDMPLEFFLNAMRLKQGVPKDSFEKSTGIKLKKIEPHLYSLVEKGLLYPLNARLQPTPKGQQFLNDLLAGFL